MRGAPRSVRPLFAVALGVAACSTPPSPTPTVAPASPAPTLASPAASPTSQPIISWQSAPIGIESPDVATALAVRPGRPDLYVAVTEQGTSWRSTDRTTWQEGGELAFSGGSFKPEVLDLTYRDGRFIAVGRESAPPYGQVEATWMWTSADGVAWKRTSLGPIEIRGLSPETEPLAGAAISGEVAHGGGVALFDGTTWNVERPHDAIIPWGFGAPEDVLPVDGGFLVVGGRTPTNGETVANALVFDGDDGWRLLTNESPTGPGLEDLVFGPDGFAALGAWNTFWSAVSVDRWSPPRTLPFEADRLFNGPGDSLLIMGDGIWQSSDGQEWVRSGDGTAPVGRWAYAAGVAIGCDEDDCVTFVVDDTAD